MSLLAYLTGAWVAFMAMAILAFVRDALLTRHERSEAARLKHNALMRRLEDAQDAANARLKAMLDAPTGRTLRVLSVALVGLLLVVAGAEPSMAAPVHSDPAAAAAQAAELAAIQRSNLIEIAIFLGVCISGMAAFTWWVLNAPVPPSKSGFAVVFMSTLAALAAFAGAHRLMAYEAANMEEQAAYIVWQGQCRRAEVLCAPTALEYLDHHPLCDTDTDCMLKFGGDGGPAPATAL